MKLAWGKMVVEILAKRKSNTLLVEVRAADRVRFVLHMGTTREDIESRFSGVVTREVLSRLIKLWSNSDAKRKFVNFGQDLLISEPESV